MDFSKFKSINLSLSEKINALERLYWSQRLDFRVIKVLASYVDVYEVSAGQTLFSEGEKGIFLINSFSSRAFFSLGS